MIVVKLMGGLGNQMFQFAAGKALALHLGTTLKLDDSYLNRNSNGKYTQRKFELGGFKLSEKLIGILHLYKFDSKLIRGFNRLFRFKSSVLNESNTHYQTNFFETKDNALIIGYWQSEKYFKLHEKQIRNDFIIDDHFLNGIEENKAKVLGSNSVSLHVRRGDYVTNTHSNYFHGVCGINYYEDAVKFISNSVSNLELFVFSDDIEWCKENLKFNYAINFIDTKSAYKDLYLMQNCKHNIIANSSFSWWGAWLNKSESKIVVAPKKWFADELINTNDLYPENWIKI